MPASQRNQLKTSSVRVSAYRIERGLLLAMTCALPLSFWASGAPQVSAADVAVLAPDSTSAALKSASELPARAKITKTTHRPAVKDGWFRIFDFK